MQHVDHDYYQYWLAPGRFISRGDRAKLERDYAALCDTATAYDALASTPVPAHSEQHENFTIEGPPEFMRATKSALGLLRGTAGAGYLRYVTCIRAAEWFAGAAGGWCIGTEIEFPQSTWRDLDARQYAGSIAHEAVHASGVDGSGDGERKCRTVEAQVLHSLGMPTSHLEW